MVSRFLFFISFAAWTIHASRVELVNNGYVNLVVAIKPSTPKHQSEIIINNIKKMIQQASPVLYKATDNRAYFRGVNILIPESWDHIEANLSSWETFQTADVIVDEPNPKYRDRPYARQNGQCGEPGEQIHLTSNYVATLEEEKTVRMYGKPGKVFVHEWAHYRYGVFDEYGTAGDTDYPLFYRLQNSESIVPNICTDQVPLYSLRDVSNNSPDCQIDPKTNIYDQNCRYTLLPEFQPESSLASINHIDSVVHFCRDDQKLAHKYDAPNKHNAMCGLASTWSVIMRSPDFAKEKNNNPIDLAEIPVDFQIVRANKTLSSRFMLVFDVSSSMKICNRIGKLAESVRTWIKNDLPSGSQLGMVKFSYYAHIVSELQVITDMKSREAMMKKVPSNQVFSETCIGCGLTIAAQMLKEVGDGGIILLATDGQNTKGLKDICDVEREILDAGIRVITIAIGKDADKNLESLAHKTDGKTYYVCDKSTSAAFHEAYMGALTYQSSVSDSDLHFKLFESKIASVRPRTYVGYVDVDATVGRNLKLTVMNVVKMDLIGFMKLTGPDGKTTDRLVYDSGTSASVTVNLAEIGRWKLSLQVKEKQVDPLLLTVTTQLRPEVKTPITTRCWVARGGDARNACTNPVKIHAQVMKGNHAVIGATVRAYIEKPNNEIEIVELLDNGVNADTTLNDGVYTKYFPNATQPGRYSVKCQVTNNGQAYESLGFIASASPSIDDYPSETKQEKIGNFSRIISGGSFQVETPVSGEDAYPPGDVKDLSAIVVDETETDVSVHLRWTAPGDELDSGIVKYYEIKYSDKVSDLIQSNFNDTTLRVSEHDVVAGSLRPHQAGAPQSVVFFFPGVQRDRPYYVALRAIDKANKTSKVSNMAAFFVPQKTGRNLEYLNEVTISQDIKLISNYFDDMEDDESPSDGATVWIVISSTAGSILILSLATFMLILFLKRIRRTKPYHVITITPTI